MIDLTVSIVKGILNQDAVDIVNDLTVSPELLEEAKKEAESLPQLEISTLDLQWVQVSIFMVSSFILFL